ncbi:hypothetical protein EV702DRAFT_1269247 [Suillus placidus]|uniref:Uncharacterized protein n=1 Tax=Suillus placidus TaxID=48579 RepID=A0A9P7D278_9AGAM|nr:hypothetical protein EV702DRAFT_1269247 [Suillus placidus]
MDVDLILTTCSCLALWQNTISALQAGWPEMKQKQKQKRPTVSSPNSIAKHLCFGGARYLANDKYRRQGLSTFQRLRLRRYRKEFRSVLLGVKAYKSSQVQRANVKRIARIVQRNGAERKTSRSPMKFQLIACQRRLVLREVASIVTPIEMEISPSHPNRRVRGRDAFIQDIVKAQCTPLKEGCLLLSSVLAFLDHKRYPASKVPPADTERKAWDVRTLAR